MKALGQDSSKGTGPGQSFINGFLGSLMWLFDGFTIRPQLPQLNTDLAEGFSIISDNRRMEDILEESLVNYAQSLGIRPV